MRRKKIMERITTSFTLMLSSEVVTLKGGRRVVLEFSSCSQHPQGDISHLMVVMVLMV